MLAWLITSCKCPGLISPKQNGWLLREFLLKDVESPVNTFIKTTGKKQLYSAHSFLWNQCHIFLKMVSFPGLTHDANTPSVHKIHPLNTLPKIIYSNIKQNNICQENKTKKGRWILSIEYFSILIPKALHQKPREHHSWPRSWNTSRFSVGKTILGINSFLYIYKLLQFNESSLARKIIPAWIEWD